MSAREMFSALTEAGLYELRGDCMVVEELPQEEVKTASGLVVPTAKKSIEGYSADKPIFVRVLQVGEGYEGEDGGKRDLDFAVGDILLVGPLSTVKWYSDLFGVVSNTAERRLGVMQGFSENAYMVFKTEEAYRKAYEVVEKYK